MCEEVPYFGDNAKEEHTYTFEMANDQWQNYRKLWMLWPITTPANL